MPTTLEAARVATVSCGASCSSAKLGTIKISLRIKLQEIAVAAVLGKALILWCTALLAHTLVRGAIVAVLGGVRDEPAIAHSRIGASGDIRAAFVHGASRCRAKAIRLEGSLGRLTVHFVPGVAHGIVADTSRIAALAKCAL